MAGAVVGIALLVSGLPAVAAASPAGPSPRALPPADPAGATPSPAAVPAPVPAPPADGPPAYNLSHGLAWSQVAPSNPGGMADSGFAAIAPTGEGILFGGDGVGGLSSGTYLYNESENRWTNLAPPVAPSPRSDFGLGAAPNATTVVLFGGLVNTTTDAVANDTWVFSTTTDTWANVTGAVAPPAREDPAFAVGDGIALLFGGWAQNYSSLGQVTYSDTWLLNLTTDVWTRLTFAGLPEPVPSHGGALLYDPTTGTFLLYGGCYPCTSAVWTFSPTTRRWVSAPTFGPTPVGRENPVWVYDPARQLAILFGGSTGTAALNDTDYFNLQYLDWTSAATSVAPRARSGAAAGFLNTPGNATLLLIGGRAPLNTFSDSWRLSDVSNLTILLTNATSDLPVANATVVVDSGAPITTGPSGIVNASGVAAALTTVTSSALGFLTNSSTVWVPPGVNLTLAVALTPIPPGTILVVVTEPNGTSIVGARVNLTIDGLSVPDGSRLTNDSGEVEWGGVPEGSGFVTVALAGDHGNLSAVDAVSNQTTEVLLVLWPLLVLQVHTIGALPDDVEDPLENVAVKMNGVIVGTTNPDGWLNLTTQLVGRTLVIATVYGFSPAVTNLTLVYSGIQAAPLILQALPLASITVQVFVASGALTGQLVQHALVNVTSVENLPTGPYHAALSTGTLGTVAIAPLPGNYSLTAWAPGCETNRTVPTVDAMSGQQLYVPIYLKPLPLASFHVLVLSTGGDHPPIPLATVTLTYIGLNLTTGTTYPANVSRLSGKTGWANFSGIPQTQLVVAGRAAGFAPNQTTDSVLYGQNVSQFILWLTPLTSVSQTPPGVRIFPANVGDVWSLLVLPALALLGAIVYLTVLRTPSRPKAAKPAGPSADEETRRLLEQTP